MCLYVTYVSRIIWLVTQLSWRTFMPTQWFLNNGLAPLKMHQRSLFCGVLTWQQNNILLNLSDRVRVILFSLSPGLKHLTAASFNYLSSWKLQHNSSNSWILEQTNDYAFTWRTQTSVAVREDCVQAKWKYDQPAFRLCDTSRLKHKWEIKVCIWV